MSLFKQLYHLDVNSHTEQVQGLTYLSWAWAWAEVKKVDEAASIEIHEFPMLTNDFQVIEGVTVPYLKTPEGYFVKVSVTIKGHVESEMLPVMDNKNVPLGTIGSVWVKAPGAAKATKEFGQTPQPTSFDINKSHKRCLVKAIAMHGLGLYIYAGEDVPEKDNDIIEKQRQDFIKMINQIVEGYGEPVQTAIKAIETHKNVNKKVVDMPLEWLEKTYNVANQKVTEIEKTKKEALEESK
jgi:hypothetical protein